jgi:succinyl-CoA synthetase beta subunit
MRIHEYQGKALLREYGIPVPRGEVVVSPQEARRAAETLGGTRWAVKAQIHAGGRGKGGGIRLATDLSEVEDIAAQLLGHRLVTPQTGPEGQEVRRLLVEEGCEIAQELYCSLLVDRAVGQPLVMLSAAGGMDIEEVAATTPDKIFREHIDVLIGLASYQARRLVLRLEGDPEVHKTLPPMLQQLYTFFRDQDCSLLEINPLVITAAGAPVALDVKLQLDDNALFRHPHLAALRDPSEEEPLEVEAAKYRLNYIKLSGNVGCIVNGAGLAMATMDIIKLAGAAPANFLDVGGAANPEMVENAFRILMSDPEVRAVLINVFGGILRCDVFARGVLRAVTTVNVQVPIVVRMEGTNVEAGQRLLAESGLNFVVTHDLEDAAQKVVQALRHQGVNHEHSR